MTSEEAIKELSYIADEMPSMECGDWKEALHMAIKTLEQEPCEDAISRHDVECIVEELENICHNAPQEVLELLAKLKNAPFATPYPKTGHWIEVIDEIDSLGNKTWHHKCSICGNEDSGWGNYKFCPNCGAKMESES